jgi:hypothetical protein
LESGEAVLCANYLVPGVMKHTFVLVEYGFTIVD